ncbi:hypothetical protein GF325_10305 [Candidatus Bathyarchaeota archaeon]|nr:hypothetical protein [Candidatus Bathyarchaeota archaeon]
MQSMSRSFQNIFSMMDNNPIKYDIVLPGFFRTMFDLNHGYVMLIKGEPGTGKTTLAMELCNKWVRDANVLFLSTRSNLGELKSQYNWFVQQIGTDAITDLESLELTDDKLKLLNIDDGNFFKVFMRFERLIKKISRKQESRAKPNQEHVGNSAGKGDGKAPSNKDSVNHKTIVIIDSIDKLIDVICAQNNIITESKIFESIINFTRVYNLKLLLISEQAEKGKSDYLVDGIIKLACDTTTIQDRILRYLRVIKLRNIPIEFHEILFSLHEGRFRMIRPHKPRLSLLPFPKRISNIHDALEDNLVSQYFFINLLQAKQIMIDVEFDSNEILHFMYMIYLNVCLFNNFNVIFICPPEIDIMETVHALEKLHGKQQIERFFRIGFLPRNKYEGTMPPYVYNSISGNVFEEFRGIKNELENLRNQKPYNGTVFILPLDHVYNSYAHEKLTQLYQFLLSERYLGEKDTLICTNLRFKIMEPAHIRFSESFSARILFYMRGLQIAKTQLFYWVKMPRPAYALYPKFKKHSRKIQLEDIYLLPIM